MTTVTEQITAKLQQTFSPVALVVTNESHRHAGHASSPGTGQSHFHVAMTAAAFAGLGRVARQRLVYAALADELAGPIHALSLDLQAP